MAEVVLRDVVKNYGALPVVHGSFLRFLKETGLTPFSAAG